ncbi:MAG: ECF transporter S component [Clostridiales bacterium]|nr:ECF transporter S component [Clostridiales bacterium]
MEENTTPVATEATPAATKKKESYFSSTMIAFIAMFATLAGVLYILNFSIPFAFPSFLEFKLSDVPILIGAFALGPAPAAIIVVIEILIKLVIKGTSTMFVGELSDLVTSCVFAVTAGLIYSKHRSFKGALVGMAIGTLLEVVVAILFNWLVLVPFYLQVFFGGNWQPLIGMMTPLFPSCTQETFYVFYLWVSVLPFNLLRCLIASLITLLVYKRISRLISRVNRKLYPTPHVSDNDGETDAPARRKLGKADIIIICVASALFALLVLFALLRYFVF